MSLKDDDYLGEIIDNFDVWIQGLKEGYGNIMKNLLAYVFNTQGIPTLNTNPLEARAVNPHWKPLSPLTIQLKGSSAILMDTRHMINFAKWQIEDSHFDNLPGVVKFGWFEDSGDRAYIATIHEYGLTGTTFVSDSYELMGGARIGRTPQARANVKAWFKRNFGLNVSGRVLIPERSMLRKTADLLVPQMEALAWKALVKDLELIIKNPSSHKEYNI